MSTSKDDISVGESPNRSPKKPTLKTIAQLSGLAVPTVSRALSGASDIGKSTRERVRKIADEIGYVPNRAGVRLRTGRTNVISLVLSSDDEVMNHTAQLVSSIAGGLRGTPYHMIITPYFATDDPMKPVRYLVETGSADAIILNMIKPEDERIAYLMERGVPFATHGRTKWSDKHAYFDFDNETFGKLTMQKCLAKDRRNILMVAPRMDQTYAQLMVGGATSAVEGHNATFSVSDRVTSDHSSAEVEAGIYEHLSQTPDIDAIICASVTSAMASVAALERTGRVVGRDIDVAAKEAIPLLKLFRREMIVVDEDMKKAGQFLSRAAVQAIQHPDLPPLQGLEIPE
jgi:LacI family transcriptional regulator